MWVMAEPAAAYGEKYDGIVSRWALKSDHSQDPYEVKSLWQLLRFGVFMTNCFFLFLQSIYRIWYIGLDLERV